MAMIQNQPKVNSQPEETPNVADASATHRSSSVGRVFQRLFSKSPGDTQRAASEASPVSVLGIETPQESLVLRDGARGRAHPKHSGSAPTASDMNLLETSYAESIAKFNTSYPTNPTNPKPTSLTDMGGQYSDGGIHAI